MRFITRFIIYYNDLLHNLLHNLLHDFSQHLTSLSQSSVLSLSKYLELDGGGAGADTADRGRIDKLLDSLNDQQLEVCYFQKLPKSNNVIPSIAGISR